MVLGFDARYLQLQTNFVGADDARIPVPNDKSLPLNMDLFYWAMAGSMY